MSKYDTNLASEYHVLSMLYRLGMDAYLTLGNKKSVDILINKDGALKTVDVKGIKGVTLWPLYNFSNRKSNHFLALVSYLNKIEDVSVIPEVYIVPAKDVDKLLWENPNKTRKGISLGNMRKTESKYRDKWSLLK